MKKIFLMRHAKSSWKDSNIPDHDRPLKKRGEKDAKTMGKLLKSKKQTPDLIISSTATRAKETAKIVKDAASYKGKIGYTDKLYMAEMSDILKIVRKIPEEAKSVMLIGHNPGMEAFLQTISGKVETLPTASIAYVAVSIKDWEKLSIDTEGKLKNLWRPKDQK